MPRKMSAWLDVRRGGPDLRSPILVEQHRPYQQLQKWPNSRLVQLVMLVRGQNCRTEKLQRQVWMFPTQSAVLLDCNLHQYRQVLPLEAGPQPPCLTASEIKNANDIPIHDLADHFYSRMLSSICSSLVLIEDEHGGVHNIAAKLALWATLASTGACYRHQPDVLILTSNSNTLLSSRKTEEMIIANMLKYHNPFKEMSFAMARKAWRACFSGIEIVQGSPNGTLNAQVQSWTSSTAKGSIVLFDIMKLEKVFTSMCRQFTEDYEKPFCFTQAFHNSPVPLQLSLQIQDLARNGIDLEMYQDIVFVTSRSLALDAFRSGLCSLKMDPDRHVPGVFLKEWFAEYYWPLLRDTGLSTMKSFIEQEFVRICNMKTLPRFDPKSRLLTTPIAQDAAVCLSCLAGVPITLPCNHNVCKNCIGNMRSNSCALCDRPIMLMKALNPPSAGVRVLALNGSVGEATRIVAFLKKLRSSLCGELVDYFDIVTCDGIGTFFAVMLFCLDSTIEDCQHQVPKLDRVVVNKDKISFAKNIQFSWDSLRSGHHILWPKSRYTVALRSKVVGAALSKLTSPPSSKETINPWDKVNRIWPGDLVHIIVHGHSDIGAASANLLASLFYVECEEAPRFYSTSPIVLALTVKCRLSNGSHLFNVANRARRQKTRIYIQDDGILRPAVLCDDTTWTDLQAGRAFHRVLYMKITSPQSRVHVQMDNLFTSGTTIISDCTADSLSVDLCKRRSRGHFEEWREQLEASLSMFI